ncbi:hypothetical protein T484DRAFT_1917506 [Baffinella frigidus]|nr:hypothetical protein T484DRAFT_1917506 [Cryptophyta sp. CCMP2293]
MQSEPVYPHTIPSMLGVAAANKNALGSFFFFSDPSEKTGKMVGSGAWQAPGGERYLAHLRLTREKRRQLTITGGPERVHRRSVKNAWQANYRQNSRQNSARMEELREDRMLKYRDVIGHALHGIVRRFAALPVFKITGMRVSQPVARELASRVCADKFPELTAALGGGRLLQMCRGREIAVAVMSGRGDVSVNGEATRAFCNDSKEMVVAARTVILCTTDTREEAVWIEIAMHELLGFVKVGAKSWRIDDHGRCYVMWGSDVDVFENNPFQPPFFTTALLFFQTRDSVEAPSGELLSMTIGEGEGFPVVTGGEAVGLLSAKLLLKAPKDIPTIRDSLMTLLGLLF